MHNAIVAFIQGVVGVGQDGIFGNMTLNAIKSYQSRNGLVADGLVGPATLKFMVTH
jgi:peptidoglycan hydrolase-like protein with peptidoglycan-binding domain